MMGAIARRCCYALAVWVLALTVLACVQAWRLPAWGQVLSIEQANEAIRQAEAAFERGHGKEAIALWRQALETARAAHDSKGQVRLLEQLGTTAGLIGDPGEATGYLAEALRLTRQIGDQKAEERVISKLAENAKAAKNFPATIAAYRELLARAKASGDKQAQALNSGVLGKALREAGQPEAAIPLLRDAASLFGAGG
jgi:tetratricopeptide (TPR) repeat protein